jgi:nitrogen fixation NifU-like protein
MNPQDLYKQTLLKHSKTPSNERELANPTHEAQTRNPLCGDEISVYLKIDDDTINTATFTAQCCSICKASASMLTERLEGLSLTEANTFAQSLINQLKDKEQPLTLPEDDELRSLEGVKQFTSRIRCATLPWEALLASLAKQV